MSSPDVESPFSTYSYPSELTLSTPQTSSEAQPSPRPFSSDHRIPPRLRSPDLFREIFGVTRHGPSPATAASLDRPGINDIYQETMNEVNRAIQSANRAIQSAQEAFQSRRSLAGNSQSRQEIVDLTGSSPPPPPPPLRLPTLAPPAPRDSIPPSDIHNLIAADDAAYDAFLSRLTNARDIESGHPNLHDQILHPVHGHVSQLEEDSISRYTGPDSLAGPRRRFEYQQRPNLSLFGMQRTLIRSGNRPASATEEDAAIRRQNIARAQWAENLRRTAERHRQADQHQGLLASTITSRDPPSPHIIRHSFEGARRPSTQDSSSSVEAVDLTQVEDGLSLAAALSKQRQDAIQSQNESSQNKACNSGIGSEGGRTALTAYKCPICMESPQNATTTSCGHLFCHKCIIDTLKWSEQARRDDVPPSRKVRGVCPVCRKELARKEEPGHGRTLIPLEIKLISRAELKRKREEEDAAAAAAAAATTAAPKQPKPPMQTKGKGKVYEFSNCDDDHNEHNDSNNGIDFKTEDSVDFSGHGPVRQAGREAKRIKARRADSYDIDSLFDFGHDEISP